MNRIQLRSMIVIACAVVMSLLGGSAWALVCSSPGSVPTCFARAGRYCSDSDTTPCTIDANCATGFCSAVIFGKATAAPLSGTMSITTLAPELVISTGGTDTEKTFRVHWNNAGASPLTATVTATNSFGSCTVPVRFTQRNDVPPNNDILCSEGPYTFTVVSGPAGSNLPSQAGQSACTSSTYSDCEDGFPPAHDSTYPGPPLTFPNGTLVFSIASPIHSKTSGARDIAMQMDKSVALNTKLRLAFERSTNNGVSYDSGWTDSTTGVSGSATAFVPLTRIIGTGEWSSVRVAVAESSIDFSTAVPVAIPANAVTPTIGEWGMIILSLLLLSASSVLVRQRRPALAGTGPVPLAPAPLFVPRLFLRVLGGIAVLGLVSLAALVLLGQAPSTTDIVGSLCSAGILAYVVHIWAIPEAGSS